MGYKEEIEIDKYALDDEWLQQPRKFIDWAEKEVLAIFEKDKAKEFLDLVRAELDSEIRANPSEFGLEKVTEGAISNTILQQVKYKEANGAYLEAIRDAKIFGVAKEAFEHRKKALENLTTLFINQYWAESRKDDAKKMSVAAGTSEHRKVLSDGIKRRNLKKE